ncbi:PDZ domain-containing 8-like, partial [Paramuricea clavata]
VCVVECHGHKPWVSHLLGAKHKKALEQIAIAKAEEKNEMFMNKTGGPMRNNQFGNMHNNKPYNRMQKTMPKPRNMPSVAAHDFAQYPEPLIGLEYLTEIQVAGQNPRYECSVCITKFDHNLKFPHLVGQKHRMNVLKIKRPVALKGVASKKRSEITSILARESIILEVEEGRQLVKTRVKNPPFSFNADYSQQNNAGRGATRGARGATRGGRGATRGGRGVSQGKTWDTRGGRGVGRGNTVSRGAWSNRGMSQSGGYNFEQSPGSYPQSSTVPSDASPYNYGPYNSSYDSYGKVSYGNDSYGNNSSFDNSSYRGSYMESSSPGQTYPGQTYSDSASQFSGGGYSYSTPPPPQIPYTDNRNIPSTVSKEVETSTTKEGISAGLAGALGDLELRNFFKKLSELPEEDIRERLRTPETCVCLNVVFAFLWKEWRDSPEMKRIFVSKLTREFNDLIGSKAAKGIIEEINVKSYSLGESLPIIKDAALINIRSQSAEDVPDEIDIALNITYSGGFYVSADLALALSKSVYLSIKVVKISGKVKLSFRRYPTSCWFFSFYEEPEPTIELDAESRFEGKNFQQMNSLIIRHFKKVIRRKYILPNYIIRYKPFLRTKIPQDEQNGLYIHNSQVTVGSVAVQVIGCSRLPLKKKSNVECWTFCSLSVDYIPFAERKNDDPSLWPIAEYEVVRNNERKIGLTFREVSCTEGDSNRKKIVIDSIDPESPVDYSSLKEGDIILEINGMPVVDAKQASKLIRGSSRRLSIMVKRPPSYMPMSKTQELSQKIEFDSASITGENSPEFDDVDDFQDEFINIVMPLIKNGPDDSQSFRGKSDDTISNLNLSVSKSEYEKSGRYNTDVSLLLEKSQQKSNESEETFGDDYEKGSSNTEKKTKFIKSSKNPYWNETFELRVEKEHKYLNVLVWYRILIESAKEDNSEEQQTKDILLGYVTIPLTDIAVQCLETGDRYHQQEYVLVSTAYDKVLASRSHLNGHPGLNRVACGGDITLAFTYKPSFDNDEETSVKTKVLTSEKIDKELSQSSDQLEILDVEVTKHNFGDTQFYYQTKCEFCSKKIWTKSGYQCRLCGNTKTVSEVSTSRDMPCPEIGNRK